MCARRPSILIDPLRVRHTRLASYRLHRSCPHERLVCQSQESTTRPRYPRQIALSAADRNAIPCITVLPFLERKRRMSRNAISYRRTWQDGIPSGPAAPLQSPKAVATASRSAGSTSAANHGLRRSHAVVRQEGCGKAKYRGIRARNSRGGDAAPRSRQSVGRSRLQRAGVVCDAVEAVGAARAFVTQPPARRDGRSPGR
jgi:hypothetical protein